MEYTRESKAPTTFLWQLMPKTWKGEKDGSEASSNNIFPRITNYRSFSQKQSFSKRKEQTIKIQTRNDQTLGLQFKT